MTDLFICLIKQETQVSRNFRTLHLNQGMKLKNFFLAVEIGINSTISIKEKNYPYGECTMPKNIIGVPRKMLSLMPLRERARANGARIITGCLLFAFIAVLCAFAFLLYKRHGTIFPSNAVRYVRNV